MASIYDEILANDARLRDASAQIPATAAPVPEAAPAPSIYDTLIARDRAAQAKATEYLLGSLVANNPDTASREQYLAKQNRLPLDVVQRNYEMLDKQDKVKRIQDAVIHSPILRRQLSDPRFAALVHDDVERLGEIERKLRQAGGGALEAVGMAVKGTMNLLDIGARAIDRPVRTAFGNTVADWFWYEPPSWDPLLQINKSADYTKRLAQERIMIPVDQRTFADDVAAGLGQVAGQIAMLPLARGMGLYAQGADVMADKVAPDASGSLNKDLAILGGAAVTGVTEKWALDKLLGPMAGTVKNQVAAVLARIGVAGAAEGGQEFAENVLHDTIRKMMTNPNAQVDWGGSTYEGGVGAAVGGIVRSIVEAGLHVRMRAHRAEQAQIQADFLQNINDLVKADKLVQRDPEAFERFIAEATEDGALKHVYIDAQTLMQSGVVEQIAQVSPSVAQQLPVATRTGGQIAIPIEEYAARIAPTEQSAALLDHLKTEPDGFSRSEAQAYMQEHGQELEAQVEKALTERTSDDTFKQSTQAVRENLKTQMDTAARFTPEVNAAYATMVSNAYAVQAARLGTTPEALFERYPLRVVAEGMDGGQHQNVQPIATLTGEEIAPRAADIKTLRAAAKTWYETNLRGKKVVNRASGRQIEFRNARKAFNSSANPDKLRLFAALEQVLTEGEIKGSKPPADPAIEGNTKAYHWLEADVSLDGQPVRVGVTIREDANGNLYYNHNAIEKAPNGTTRSAPPHKGGSGIAEGAYDQTIPPFADNVNLEIIHQGNSAPRGQFDPSTNTIALLKNADLSTFLHESGHFFLEMQVNLASHADAPQAIRQDMQTTLDWFGVRDLTEWHSLDFEEKRSYHEQFARGFEAYLFEGKSPNIEMQGLFQRFRAWLLHIYRDLKALNVELNDQVRGVFDRMLATNEQIALAEQAQFMLPLFASAEQAGLSPEEFAAYQALGTDATQTAIDELQSKGLRDMLWMRNTRARVLRELQKQAARQRNEMRIEARREIMRQPIYRAWQFLTARLEPENKLSSIPESLDAARLQLDELRDMSLSSDVIEALKTRRMTARLGVPPDLVAGLFGFTSGDELVRTLAAAPTPSSLIEEVTQQRMLERYGELSTPEALEKAADAAVHNEVRARMVATELNALARATGQPKVLNSAARQLAAAIVARQRVRDIKPGQYTRAAAKAAKQAEQLLKQAGRRVVGKVAEIQPAQQDTSPEALIQSPEFRQWFGERSIEQLEAEYAALPNTEGGRIIDADWVRELAPDYVANRARSAELHPYASALTKALFARALAKPVVKGRAPVVAFLAGGGGNGKSTASGPVIKALNADIVLDGTLSKLESARANIEAALASDRKVAVVYVYRSPEKSAHGAVEHAITEGRPVPVDVLADAHAGAAQTIKALAQEYNGREDIQIIARWNDGEVENARDLPVQEVPDVYRNQAEQAFRTAVETVQQSGRLAPEIYDAFLGRMVRVGRVAAQVNRGNEQARPEQHASDAITSKQTGDNKATQALAQAAAEKRNQLIQHFAARAAHDGLAEVEKGVRYLRKFNKDGTRKSIDPDYHDQIDALLERFDLRPGQSLKAIDKRISLAKWLEAQREQGIDPAIPEWLEAEANHEHYKNLTLEQFRGLVDTVKQIEHLGRLKNRLLTDQKKRALNAVVLELHDSIIENANGRVVDNERRNTVGSRVRHLWRGAMAIHRKFANSVREMDGFQDGGPVWEALVRTMNMAGDKEASMRADAARRLQVLSAPVIAQGRTGGTGVFFPTLGHSFNRGEILAMALNLGNDGNRQRLLDGRGWKMEQIQPALDTLTVADWQFVQGVWDFFESYRPEISAKERRVYGVEPQWVEAVPLIVKTRDGQTLSLRGGYYPIRYDTNLSGKAQAHDAAEQAKVQMRAAYTAATTRRSFTKTRAEEVKGQAIELSFNGIYLGANEVIHDLAWHEWLIDANRLMRRLDAPMRTHYGAQTVKAMQDAIKDVALGDAQASNFFESSLNHLRAGATISGLGWNLFTALLQPLGITQSVARVGGVWMARGLREFWGSPTHMLTKVEEINAQSEFMANRARTMNREINEVRNQLSMGKGKVRTAIEASFFVFIQKAQMTVDYPTWLAAYARAEADPKNRLSNGQPDTARLAALADQAVIDTQGGGQTKDLAQVQRGHPALKIFTNFYSFFSVAFNMAYDASVKTNFKDPMSVIRLAGDYLLILVLPAIMSGALRQAMKGGDDDDWLEGLLEEQIDYLMGMMVGLREISAAVKKIAGVGKPFGYQGPAGLRFFAEFDRLGQQISQGEIDAALLKSANNVGGILFHYPAGQVQRTVQGAAALLEGKTRNPAALMNGYRK